MLPYITVSKIYILRKHCVLKKPFHFLNSRTSTGDQLYMVECFWYLVKVTFTVYATVLCMYNSLNWKSNFLQGIAEKHGHVYLVGWYPRFVRFPIFNIWEKSLISLIKNTLKILFDLAIDMYTFGRAVVCLVLLLCSWRLCSNPKNSDGSSTFLGFVVWLAGFVHFVL